MGVGLMISGAIIAGAVIKGGATAFRSDLNAMKNDWKLGKWWDYIISYFIPVAALILLIWWMFLAITQFAPGEWLNPFNPYSIATMWMQWLILLAVLLLFNKSIVKRMMG